MHQSLWCVPETVVQCMGASMPGICEKRAHVRKMHGSMREALRMALIAHVLLLHQSL